MTTAAASHRLGHSRTSALASLILAADASSHYYHDVVVSGQIIFIPTTTVSVTLSSYYDRREPPCRARRLEPFRRKVREECAVDARVCMSAPQEERRGDAIDDFVLRSILPSASSPRGGHRDERRVESLLDAIFAPMPSDSTATREHVDPLDRFFEEMMTFSLLAFDEALASSSIPPFSALPLADAEEPVAESSEDGGGGRTAPSDGEANDAVDPDPIAPEIAAETALDVAVATLAERSIRASRTEDGGAADAIYDRSLETKTKVFEKETTGAEAVVPSPTFPDVHELHDRLFRLGSALLTEAGGERRRLLEAEAEDDVVVAVDDPHARVRERLARRLTEYRTDLFYHPDGAVTVYTRSYPPSRRAAAVTPPLGTGSDHVDECLMSRMSNGDLDGGCLEAVQAFSRATTDRTLQMIPPGGGGGVVGVVVGGTDASAREMTYYETLLFRACQIFLSNLVLLSIAFIVVAFVVDGIYASCDEDEDEDEDGGEFDYEILPDGSRDDADEVDGNGRDGEEESRLPRVYVGVPLQVV